MRGTTEAGRGARRLGPFTGGQLAIIIVALMIGVLCYPLAAGAANAIFSNNSAGVPAVQATNSNAKGIGVQGTGKRFGVYSKGPLGVAAGNGLVCTGCVKSSAFAPSAKTVQTLPSGKSESGVIGFTDNAAGSGKRLVVPISFVQPVAWKHLADSSDITHCPGLGKAAPGYVCIYYLEADALDTPPSAIEGLPHDAGVDVAFSENGAATTAEVLGSYTVSAP